MSKQYNWKSTGPGGCDAHCIEHPCGPCLTGKPHPDGLDPLRDTLAYGITEMNKLRQPWKTLECAGTHDDDELCPRCCDHMDMDGAQCLDCGEDRTEDMMAAAFDRAKAARHGG